MNTDKDMLISLPADITCPNKSILTEDMKIEQILL
jgi:hypothetical protein